MQVKLINKIENPYYNPPTSQEGQRGKAFKQYFYKTNKDAQLSIIKLQVEQPVTPLS